MKFLSLKRFIGLLSLIISTGAWPHVRWFVEGGDTNVIYDWSLIYYLLIGMAVLYGVVSYLIERKLRRWYEYSFFASDLRSINGIYWRMLVVLMCRNLDENYQSMC